MTDTDEARAKHKAANDAMIAAASPQPYPGEAVAHDVIIHMPDGSMHVRHYGPGVVDHASVETTILPPGTPWTRRHVDTPV